MVSSCAFGVSPGAFEMKVSGESGYKQPDLRTSRDLDYINYQRLLTLLEIARLCLLHIFFLTRY